ncbi:metallophosphoesterase family protein [Streptomyces sp. NEAU-W12]|uniref:metallophosphoesterase family protein n=1 Tax=Streptomyces sp. NEAU-W12 TaxID=2994668 RepID=UPI00224A86F8|nr:metallophosphoesterase [Streptomyces sp. NEAU-W12]MCX2924144.1 metallophosphoesterase [Streptomyces sp. NEAU-W12]
MRGTESVLRAVSDLRVPYEENRAAVEKLELRSPGDWLIVAGDVGERFADLEWTLGLLRDRFGRFLRVPGSHELWTVGKDDPAAPRGVARYEALVAMCRRPGVPTPEGPCPVWGRERAARCGSRRCSRRTTTRCRRPALRRPRSRRPGRTGPGSSAPTGTTCTPEPYPSRAARCAARVEEGERRLTEVAGGLPLVLVNHWPLLREPARIMTYQEFARWCGTVRTPDWHIRFGVEAVVCGHPHVPRRTVYDGVRFEEVPIGCPRARHRFGLRNGLARQVVPARGVPAAVAGRVGA